jgi:hypothetical protein
VGRVTAAPRRLAFWLIVVVGPVSYEVFIPARMREEYDASGSTDAAVARGIGRTARLVTRVALIPFLAFISLASGPQTDVKAEGPAR